MFSKNFSDYIQIKKISLPTIAKETQIPKSILYEWLAGKRLPFSNYLPILADYLDCSVDFLLGRVDDANKYANIKDKFTEREEKIIYAYRTHTDLQKAVDKILDINKKNK